MSHFGIQGYRPDWLTDYRFVARTHGRRLSELAGRRLTHGWLVWHRTDDEWFADCPVALDFEGEQVEINHQKFDELSVTWNTIDPSLPITYREASGDTPLTWRDDACSRLAAMHGQQLHSVELFVWNGAESDLATGTVAVSFGFARDRITISNALDENRVAFGPPDPAYRCVPLCG